MLVEKFKRPKTGAAFRPSGQSIANNVARAQLRAALAKSPGISAAALAASLLAPIGPVSAFLSEERRAGRARSEGSSPLRWYSTTAA